MKSELVVDVQSKDISIALIEDGRLVSLQKESRDASYAVGNIYVAKVKKLMPGLNAAFVNVGYEKDAFLHYLDLGSQFSTYSEFVKSALADHKETVYCQQGKGVARHQQERHCGRRANRRSGAPCPGG